MKRTINLSNVTSLAVNGHESSSRESNIEFVKVKGSKANVYTVTKVGGTAKECTCPGYTYRKACKHLKMV